jgi:hypothetical protein
MAFRNSMACYLPITGKILGKGNEKTASLTASNALQLAARS